MVAQVGVQRLASLVLEELSGNESFRAKVLSLLNDVGKHGRVDLLSSSDGGEEPHFVGESAAMREAFAKIRKFAATDLPVLITGESGTGKELAASAIHERSTAAKGPFVAVNCGGLPATLIASELFGYEKGAFTGASQRKIGRIEAADGGTLFLDEIGDLPLELQGHLLRFLQEKTIDRVGSARPVSVNVRVIAATNRDLLDAVQNGSFRLDLYYRLKVLHIQLPPLRDRNGDLDILVHYFLKKFAHELHSNVQGVTPAALDKLKTYTWPGNVRELISTLRRAIVMAEGSNLEEADLSLDGLVRPIMGQNGPHPGGAINPEPASDAKLGGRARLFEERSRSERDLIASTLLRNRHNVTRTATELGISRVTLYRLMDKYELRSSQAAAAAE
jgi:DNA-binding NtrC family response regulator